MRSAYALINHFLYAVLLLPASLTPSSGAIAERPTLSTVGNPAHPHEVVGVPGGFVTLYDQTGNDTFSPVVSDNFDSAFDVFDDQAADDFIVPQGHKWVIQQIDVYGQYGRGTGPADSANVFFYKDKPGLPGHLVRECDNLPIYYKFVNGTFQVLLSGICNGRLKAGHYWVSVQANMNYSGGAGEWFWDTGSVRNGSGAAWQNPNDGFGTGCTIWSVMQSCVIPSGPDLVFALKGVDKLRPARGN